MLKVEKSTPKKTSTAPTNLYQSPRRNEEVLPPVRRGDTKAKSTTVAVVEHSMDQTLTISQYKVGFAAVLQDRYIPDLPKLSNQTEGICSTWIATACDLSSFEGSSMLGDSLLAMSLALVGGERNDQDIATAGLRHYSMALNKLRVELKPGPITLSQLQMDLSLVTCLACGTYEVRLIPVQRRN